MARSLIILLGLSLVTPIFAACRHTADGVREDTSKALHKTGDGVKKAGDKVDKK